MRYKSPLFAAGIMLLVTTLECSPAVAQDSFVAEVKRYTALVSRPNTPWDGPTTGPPAQRNRSVIGMREALHGRRFS